MPALRTRDTQPRSLEVTTDAALQPPTVAIISPTPRAFTFPITHNLSNSPFSSPSHSPFEPDHHPLALQCTTNFSMTSTNFSSITTPPPSIDMRTLSPEPRSSSPISPSTTTSLQHKRRKSSCSSSDVDRRPKRGDEDYIKRPENAFILFRRKCCEDRQQAQDESAADGPTKKQRQADLSKTISQQWKGLSPEERQYWEQLAKEKKKEHEQMYPNYVYRPQRSKDKEGNRQKNKKSPIKNRKGELEHETDTESVSFVLPMVSPSNRHHGRSASAPTPPPYQSIQIPNVYHMTPSCPTSPSLLPMISRRSSHPGHDDCMSTTTPTSFMSNENLMAPPSFGQAGQFEATLQSSDFLRSMFNMAGQPMLTRSDLQPLSLTPESLLLPPAHIISPNSSMSVGSNSSGPSSPNSAPYTPTSSSLLAHSFAQLGTSSSPDSHHSLSLDSSGCDASQHDLSCLPIDLHPSMMTPQQQHSQPDFSSYSWDTNNLWSTSGSDAMLGGDDFDLSSIPPIELELPKYNTDPLGCNPSNGSGLEFGSEFVQALEGRGNQNLFGGEENLQHHQHQMLSFDEMLAGHGF